MYEKDFYLCSRSFSYMSEHLLPCYIQNIR